MSGNEISLKVLEAYTRDVGRGVARIDYDSMDTLSASTGDVIEIKGKRRTVAKCLPLYPSDEGKGIIRIDGLGRNNSGIAIGDSITVKKIKAIAAEKVIVAPLEAIPPIDERYLADALESVPLIKGDNVMVPYFGGRLTFQIIGVTPNADAVLVTQKTIFTIAEKGETLRGVPQVSYEDIGGLTDEIKKVREMIELPLRHPEIFEKLGIEAPKGVLLYGPPGTGKTLLAKAVANESNAHFISISGPEIMSKFYGESEARLREIFKEAREKAPSIVFVDEIDSIAPKREEVTGEVERRVVSQMLSLMDGLEARGKVIVISATNRPNAIDPALRRPGRFDREIEISVPNIDGRIEILQIHTRGMPIGKDVDLKKLASELHGYTGADIKSLCRESAIKAIRRYIPKIDLENKRIPSKILQSMEIQLCDLSDAMHEIVPTAMREFYVERAKILWKDVGGLSYAKKVLEDNIITSINNPNKFSKMGIRPPKGILLYGPPGCGKTLLARALAAECGTNMILVRSQDILSKWVGESEKAIREIFRKARSSAPCIIIFDEMDSLVKFKTADEGRQNDTILTQILTEMEESGAAKIGVVGITSRPDLVDNSMLRPGRLDIVLYIEAPDEKSRLEIIRILTKQMPLASDIDLNEIAVATQNYTGADIESLCREAAVNAMQNNHTKISSNDFAEGLKRVKPSITKDVEQWYSSIKDEVSKVIPKSTDKIFYG